MLSQLEWADALIPVGTVVGVVGGALVTWYITIRKNNQTIAEQRAKLTKEDRELSIKEKAAASKLRREEEQADLKLHTEKERTIAKEYIDLFEAAKREWEFANQRHKDCEQKILIQDRKIIRMELAIERAGIKLDDEPESKT